MTLTLTFAACQNDDAIQVDIDQELRVLLAETSPNASMANYIFPTQYQFLPQDPNNLLNEQKIALGKLLFHETAFAQENLFQNTAGTYSCATCHHVKAGFSSGNVQGIGEGGIGFGERGEGRLPDELLNPIVLDVQPNRSPTVLNSVYHEVMLWNGQFGSTGLNANTQDRWFVDTPLEVNFLGFQGMESQAIAAIEVHRLKFDEELVTELGYKTLFDLAFPEIDETERYNDTIAGLAMAAFERTIVASEAPFQRWLKGQRSAMSMDEKEGALLFFGKAGCVSCHNGPSLANMEFSALGFNDFDEEEVFHLPAVNNAVKGRASFTGEDGDLYKFKVPQLYNLADNPFYGHGASFRSIRAVLDYKNAAIAENPIVDPSYLDSRFQPLELSEEELDALEAFLTYALYDPNLDRYVPEEVLSGSCFPNADPLSQLQLGCN